MKFDERGQYYLLTSFTIVKFYFDILLLTFPPLVPDMQCSMEHSYYQVSLTEREGSVKLTS